MKRILFFLAVLLGIATVQAQNVNKKLPVSNLAHTFYSQGNYKEAIKYGTQDVNILKSVLGENQPDYAAALADLASYYSAYGDNEEAIRLDLKALNIYKETYGEKHPNYAASLNSLADYYAKLGNYNEAIRLCSQSLNLYKEVLGENHPNCAISLKNLASYYCHLGNYNEALALENKSLNILQGVVLNTFRDLSSIERKKLWNVYSYDFINFFPQIVYTTNTSNTSSNLYNKSALFAKGLLLSFELEMKKFIQKTCDIEVMKEYEDLRNNLMMLNKLYENPISKHMMNTDSLENLVNAQEKDIAVKCKAYGDYTSNLRLTWKDVQQKLGKHDLAVEFLSFPVSNDSIMYIALTLCKNDTAPQIVELFEQKQLKMLPDTLTYNCPEMTALVWEKMQKQLKGIKNIYFAPDGQLYSIGIEFLPKMEKYNLFRLSSTRELVSHVKTGKPRKAIAYGNINYNYDISNGMSDAQRFRLIPLCDTTELKGVTTALKSAKIPCMTYSEDKATEESFKALSGKHVNLLHISTHSFYISEEEAKDFDYMYYIQSNKDGNNGYNESRALSRSALCMAGANVELEYDSILENAEDGILTAQEISLVDLSGMDLAVLSASETGLGDIVPGEGVFGLQRGFKKAGVQSLLMSLWNVDSEATQILMAEFYKQYAAGKTKRAALQSAQQHLRNVQNGRYNQPKYWAAFILLDAID